MFLVLLVITLSPGIHSNFDWLWSMTQTVGKGLFESKSWERETSVEEDSDSDLILKSHPSSQWHLIWSPSYFFHWISSLSAKMSCSWILFWLQIFFLLSLEGWFLLLRSHHQFFVINFMMISMTLIISIKSKKLLCYSDDHHDNDANSCQWYEDDLVILLFSPWVPLCVSDSDTFFSTRFFVAVIHSFL